MRSHNIGAAEKIRLFRLAWDLAGDSSGSHQELYERWHRGDIVRNRNNLYLRYDRSHISERIRHQRATISLRDYQLDPLGKAHGTARAGR
jgi:aromatic ring hydroxylase